MNDDGLVPYGIQTDKSDYRAHVCPRDQAVYVFETSRMASFVGLNIFGKIPARQKGVQGVSGYGYTVPLKCVPWCLGVEIPKDLQIPVERWETMDTIGKGDSSVDTVKAMVERELIRFGRPSEVHKVPKGSLDAQWLLGDLVVGLRVEVKCDLPGGMMGTGNLYIQTEEKNPLSKI